MYFVFKVCQYGTNDFYIKNFKNFLINSRGNCGVVSRGGNVGFVGWGGGGGGGGGWAVGGGGGGGDCGYNAKVSDITIL